MIEPVWILYKVSYLGYVVRCRASVRKSNTRLMFGMGWSLMMRTHQFVIWFMYGIIGSRDGDMEPGWICMVNCAQLSCDRAC